MPATIAMPSPATGLQTVAMTVTRIGPVMNTTSSTEDSRAYAVSISARSSSTCAQRARTQAPTWGKAPPATRTPANAAHSGPPDCTTTTNDVIATANTTAATASTRPWPIRSSSRACGIASAAAARRYAADMVPARP